MKSDLRVWFIATIVLAALLFILAWILGGQNGNLIAIIAVGLVPLTINAVLIFEKQRSEKIERTIELLWKWDDKQLLEARTRLAPFIQNGQPVNPADFADHNQNSSDVVLLFNYWLKAYYSLKTDRINQDLYKFGLGSAFIAQYHCFGPLLTA